MSLEIRSVGPGDDLFADWHAVYLAANEHAVGSYHTCWTLPELRESFVPNRRRDMAAFVAERAEQYAAEVRARAFPGPEQLYPPKD